MEEHCAGPCRGSDHAGLVGGLPNDIAVTWVPRSPVSLFDYRSRTLHSEPFTFRANRPADCISQVHARLRCQNETRITPMRSAQGSWARRPCSGCLEHAWVRWCQTFSGYTHRNGRAFHGWRASELATKLQMCAGRGALPEPLHGTAQH